jgi:hypothetical protein
MSEKQTFHEDFSREDEIKVGSERSFGIVFAVVFAIIGAFPLWNGEPLRVWALIIAGAFLLVALIAPRLLKPLNILWFRFGMLLSRVVNPVVMGFLFFLTVTPIALLMRLFGKRPLHLGFDKETDSYWIKREPPGPDPQTMRQQF